MSLTGPMRFHVRFTPTEKILTTSVSYRIAYRSVRYGGFQVDQRAYFRLAAPRRVNRPELPLDLAEFYARHEGVVLPMTGVAFGLSLVLGRWVAYAYLPVGCFVIWIVFLNLAQRRIRELVRAREEERPVKSV
jgi:hypothetical protein